MKYNAVIFDFDGTVANTSKDVWDSVEYAANKVGSKLPDTVKKDDTLLILPLHELFRLLEPIPPEDMFVVFENEIARHYRTISNYPATDLYPGVEDFIKLLMEKNIPRYIVTMKNKIPLERILKLKNWSFMFNGWYTPDYRTGNIYTKEELIRILINTELAGYNSVYIGDSYTDVIAARKNNIDCIGVTYGDGDINKLLDQKPTYVINNASELISYFIKKDISRY